MFGFRDETPPVYEQLPTGETKTLPLQRRRSPPWTRRALYLLAVLWNIVLLTGAIHGLKSYLAARHPGPVIKPISCDCGASTAEAKSLGCKYDTLSVSWLPPQCRDDALTEEFNHAGPDGEWHYWADRNRTQHLTVSQVAALADKPIPEAQFWTTFGWHVAHCSFYWRKEYRMRARGMEMEHRYDRESHIKHCHMAFMSREPLDNTNTQAAVGLGGDRVGGVRTEAQKEFEMEHEHDGHHHG